MTTSSRVKALLELTETDQNTFAAAFGMTTPQAMNNKLRRDSWSAKDLARGSRDLRRKAGVHSPGWLPAHPCTRRITATPAKARLREKHFSLRPGFSKS